MTSPPTRRQGPKVAYVTTHKAVEIGSWSGLTLNILRAVESTGLPSEVIDDIGYGSYSALYTLAKKAFYRTRGLTYLRERSPVYLAHVAAEVQRRLREGDADVILGPGSLPLALLETTKPIVLYADATFAGMLNYYKEFSNLCDESIRDGHRMEQEALSRCALALFASEWAADTARAHYHIDPAKVHVVPFGANLDSDRTEADITRLASRKPLDTCKLLFVGVDWERKGGDLALAVARLLTARGLPTELHVAGCAPPPAVASQVTNHGYLSKATPEGRARLDELFSDSHFLLLPSKAECFGVVFAEASSFGLPSLATRTGGIPTAVRDGYNGFTFDLEAGPEAYADVIQQHLESRDAYESLARSSFHEYVHRLNWQTAGETVRTLLEDSFGHNHPLG